MFQTTWKQKYNGKNVQNVTTFKMTPYKNASMGNNREQALQYSKAAGY